ncbi:MAG: ATP phosphoribosyltransferase regulatory subunit, partial [Deltaproteobacteria bacterium]|nr:ATP phosphoribosyltransferase regulatory subunit [Deltaproteobacteria bacterium]
PLRLCYEGPVVRHVAAQKGRSRQLYQVGGEILGAPGPDADAETVALVVECIRAAGIDSFKVDVGQVEFFKGILAGVELPPDAASHLRASVARKDASDLGRLLEGLDLPDAKKRVLAELPLLAGGVEVLGRAADVVESDHSRAALDNLAAVVDRLSAQGLGECLTIDLGELRGVDYHSGIVFEAFVHHLPVALCKGGRYDRLLERYGHPLPATGFTLDLVALLEALRVQAGNDAGARRSGVFVVGLEDRETEGAGLARQLRNGGARAAQELLRRPVGESIRYAAEQGFAWVVVLGTAEAQGGEALLVNAATGESEAAPLEEISRRLAGEE